MHGGGGPNQSKDLTQTFQHISMIAEIRRGGFKGPEFSKRMEEKGMKKKGMKKKRMKKKGDEEQGNK